MKVYIAEVGCYSDTRIIWVYSTPEKAQKMLDIMGGDSPRYEEWELDDESLLEKVPQGLFLWGVRMKKDGKVIKVEREDLEHYIDRKNVFIEEGVSYGDWEPYSSSNSKGGVIFYVFAKDEEHATKIANEKRTGLILSNLWTEDFDKWYKCKGVYLTLDTKIE